MHRILEALGKGNGQLSFTVSCGWDTSSLSLAVCSDLTQKTFYVIKQMWRIETLGSYYKDLWKKNASNS